MYRAAVSFRTGIFSLYARGFPVPRGNIPCLASRGFRPAKNFLSVCKAFAAPQKFFLLPFAVFLRFHGLPDASPPVGKVLLPFCEKFFCSNFCYPFRRIFTALRFCSMCPLPSERFSCLSAKIFFFAVSFAIPFAVVLRPHGFAQYLCSRENSPALLHETFYRATAFIFPLALSLRFRLICVFAGSRFFSCVCVFSQKFGV